MRVVPARLTHTGPLATRMREDDRIECAALGRTPKEALRLGAGLSLHAFTAIGHDGVPVAMFGVYAVNMLAGHGKPWFLGSDDVFRYSRQLLTMAPCFIQWWQSELPTLENIVAVDNTKAISLLNHWGAVVGGKLETHRGVTFVPFHFPAIQADQQNA